VRRAIGVAESIAPAVLWVDEIDKAFVGFAKLRRHRWRHHRPVFGTFLTWLSEKSAPVFVVANRQRCLPTAAGTLAQGPPG